MTKREFLRVLGVGGAALIARPWAARAERNRILGGGGPELPATAVPASPELRRLRDGRARPVRGRGALRPRVAEAPPRPRRRDVRAGTGKDPSEGALRARIQDLLRQAVGASGTTRGNPGVGTLFEFRLLPRRGAALVAEARVVHLAIL